jgi:diguanylate cyclase (GGDEF)-like protein
VRAVTVGLCAVLAALAAVAIVGGLYGERSAARLTRSGDLVQAYLDLTHAVAIQEATEGSLGDLRVRRERFNAAAATIASSLGVLEREGTAADQALRARIERSELFYAADMNGSFAALEAGNADRAAIFETAADPSSQALQTLVSERGPRLASESLREIGALRSLQDRILHYTLLSVVVGALVVLALWLVLRSLRRRIDDATADELERLERATLTDSLTGTRNHRAFEEDLARALAHRRRHGTGLSLVMIDLDGLKAINDQQGHQAGDRAIKTVADVLRGALRAEEVGYRTGGDEFAALLPEASAWGAFSFAQRLHDSLIADGARVGVSVGLAEATETSTRDGLVEQADLALSEAKASGRDTILFVPGMARPQPADDGEDRRHRGTLASALARAVDAKDAYTRSHSETVAELCAMIAVDLGLEPERVASIRLAGLVHDVGKIGVPDAILQKPDRLDAAEYETIKTHSALGHRILQGTDLSHEAPWVLHHHERMDGGGYPDGLAGSDIPLESRIIHVADAFEAMTSDRPYRRGMPESDALEELRRHTATQFDPACVTALLTGLGAASAVTVGAT